MSSVTRVRLWSCPVCQASGTFTTEPPAKEDSRGACLQDGDSCADGGRRKFPWGREGVRMRMGTQTANLARRGPGAHVTARWPRGGAFLPEKRALGLEGGAAQGRAGRTLSARTPSGLGPQRLGPQASGHSPKPAEHRAGGTAGALGSRTAPGRG